jgi:hypothetical protein
MIEPYVIWDNGEQTGYTHLRDEASFTNSLITILNYIKTRISAAKDLSLESDFEYDASKVSVNQVGWQRGQR